MNENQESTKYVPELLRGLTHTFDKGEMEVFAFECLEITDWDEVTSENRTKSQTAKDLILYIIRRGRLEEFIRQLKEVRPNYTQWPVLPSENPTLPFPILFDKQSANYIHKYSGIWSAQNSFSIWRKTIIEEPNMVTFTGRTMLTIPPNGEEGSGVQIGKLTVDYNDYHAVYEIANEVENASVDEKDILRMNVRVIHRNLIEENPTEEKDPEGTYAKLREDLKESGFSLTLKPESDKLNILKGTHIHEIQAASEEYVFMGLFGPPRLEGLKTGSVG